MKSIEAEEGTISDEDEGTVSNVKVLRSQSRTGVSGLKLKFKTIKH